MYINIEKTGTNYAAPEAPAIFIVLGLLCISAFIEGFNQTWGYIKLSNKPKKLLLAPFLLFYFFYGFSGLILILLGFSSFTYDYSYIFPTVMGFVFGLILSLFTSKYLIYRWMLKKIFIIAAVLVVSISMIFIARQMHYFLNVNEIFLRSFVASSISAMILYSAKILATFKIKFNTE